MADKEQGNVTSDEKLAQAQELLSIATRNYYVKAYADAVDDFSTVCSIFSELYGPTGIELGKPYLLYAKCLIALGQDENKLMEIPEEQESDDSGDDEDDGAPEQAADDAKIFAGNEHVDPAQPGTSTGITKSEMDHETNEDEADNLQIAWEVLELAVSIFSQQPERAPELAECYRELGGISIENENFQAAIEDFQRGLTILMKLPNKEYRELAEINYKIGLSYTMQNMFDDAKTSFEAACAQLDIVIKAEEAKGSPETVVSDLKESKAEIENKIAEVEGYKQQCMDEVKRELSKLIGPDSGATVESLSPTKPAGDISHLIKRKKPEDSDVVVNNVNHLDMLKTADEV